MMELITSHAYRLQHELYEKLYELYDLSCTVNELYVGPMWDIDIHHDMIDQ